MGGIAKPLVINDPTTGKPGQVIPLSTIGLNATDPGPDYTNPSAVAQATNNPTALPAVTPPAATPKAPAPAPAPAPATAQPPPTTNPYVPTSGLLSDPGAYENWIKNNVGQMDTPTDVETMFHGGAADALKNPSINDIDPIGSGQLSDWYSQHGGDLTGPSAAETLFGELPTGPTASRGVFDSQSGSLSGEGSYEKLFDEMGDAFNAPGAYENTYAQHGKDLSGPGYTEKLYESGIGQLDPYYDYAEKRAIEGAQRASAARGGFNSGLAGQQESDIEANLHGQQAQQWVNLAPQADAAKLARMNALFGEAAGNDSAHESRIKDAFGLAADDQTMGEHRISQLSDLASSSDSADMARENARINAAANADSSSLSRFNAGEGAASDADKSEENRWNDSRSLANDKDATTERNINDLFNLAGESDSSRMGRFNEQAGLEKDLQATGQGRLEDALTSVSGLSQQESELASKIYGDMSSVNQLDDTWLQAEADKYGVSLQELSDIMSSLGKAGSIATNLLPHK